MVHGYQPPRPGPLQPGLTAEYPYRDGAQDGTDWFRFGDGFLELRSDHAGFRARFVDLYSGCRVAGPAPALPVVRCAVTSQDGGARVRVAFDDPEPLDQVPFSLESLADFGYVEAPAVGEQRRLVSATTAGDVVFDAAGFVAGVESPWPTIAGPIAVHRVLRLQPGTLFFHAAAVGIKGRGLLLMGPKEAGKTTLSLALAERGHQFFSDEMSAVRRESLEILPFHRRLSIRPGPKAPGVRAALDRGPFPTVELDDGTQRTRAQPVDIVDTTMADPVVATAIAFIGAKQAVARAERFAPTVADLNLLAPYESAAWGQSPARLAMGLMRMLARVRCYHLTPGTIDDTTRLLEALVMEE